ncbi:synaptopodin [Brachyhypopomus gauderio]|uniref:synaptopodin n=1 Tax=Brachyhypopomus gauderio TaxID=698409 RepID=UPI004043880A
MDGTQVPVSRGSGWAQPAATTLEVSCSTSGDGASEDCGQKDVWSSLHAWEQTQSWTEAEPALVSGTTHAARKTSLGRSASLSEKELKEARSRSHIIATQLTLPSSGSSRGVQLFNRRRQRVDAFTLVSVGAGQGEESWSASKPPSTSARDSRAGHSNPRSSSGAQEPAAGEEVTRRNMEASNEAASELRHGEDGVHERHFVPVREKDEETPEEHRAAMQQDTPGGNSTVAVPDQSGGEGAGLNGARESPAEMRQALPNGCHGAEVNGKAGRPVSKQPAIMNRTARPFLSPITVDSTEPGSPASPGPPTASHSTPHLRASQERPPQSQTSIKPPFPVSSRPVFSPPPPAPSYPTPPLPAAMSTQPSFPSRAPPTSTMSPPPGLAYYAPPTAPRSSFIPQLLGERRATSPIRTGLLDEGGVRRVNRKSMFTFQEKPKLAPNPELLSLVQGADEMRRVRGQPESQQEEELLALGAEASNFLAKDESGVEEALVPEWASTLKSSRTRARVAHAPQQALTDASGRGAALFAQRQSRMERYIHEKPSGKRAPSPTQSLPPSWAYPSNMPGRVKAIVSSSNISAQISKTLQSQKAADKRNVPGKAQAPPPAPVPESPAMENGCTRVEMELSRHQPYQLNSSLFIFNPIRDPRSSLPRAAPPPRSTVTGLSSSRQTSLPSSPVPTQHAYRSAHCFSPPIVAVGTASSAASPERVASPRVAAQTPKPTFSAKKAGILPQVTDDSPTVTPPNSSRTPRPWSPCLPHSPNRVERPSCAPWSPSGDERPASAPWSPRKDERPPSAPWAPSRDERPPSAPWVPSRDERPPSAPWSPSRDERPPSAPWSPSRYERPPSAQWCPSRDERPPSAPWVPSRDERPPSAPWVPSRDERPPSAPWSPSSQRSSQVTSPPPYPIHKPVTCSPIPKPFQSPSPSRTTATHTATTTVSPPWQTTCQSPISLQDTKANHRLLAKNIINAAKRKNSPSPGSLGGLPMSPLGSASSNTSQSRPLGVRSPTFTSPPPTRMVHSPLRLYTTRSLTDSDASLESEDSGVRSPGLRSFNTCPRVWTGSLRVKRGGASEDL